MAPDPEFGIQYCIDRLVESDEKLEPFRAALYEIPIVPFTTEEMIVLRMHLIDVYSLTRLLQENHEQYKEAQNNKTLFQRIFKK